VGDITLLPKVLDAAARFDPSQDVSAQPPAGLQLEPIFV
jgi:hypothetical protein